MTGGNLVVLTHGPVTSNSINIVNLNVTMVAYFCHHLSDLSVDLSDLYVDMSVIYVDLSEKYRHN